MNEGKQTRDNENGASLIEVLIAALLLMIMGGVLLSNILYATRATKYIEVHHAAATLASDRMEQLAALDIADLTPSRDESEVPVSFPDLNIGFRRSTTVTINGDGSRTVEVSVKTVNFNMPTTVTFKDNYYAW